MQISSRKDALAAGATQYLTGKPCKYGHTAKRYTQSGSCVECVAASAFHSRDKNRDELAAHRERLAAERAAVLAPILELRAAKALALRALIEIKVPANPQDLKTVFDTAIELCLAAHPALERADVQPDAQPIRGLPLYKVSIPPEHADLIRGVANALYTAHSIDVRRIHDDMARRVEAMADAAASTPPEGWK